MDIQSKIEIYSAMPYAGADGQSQDEWFHVAYNEPGNHIEAIWNIEKLFRPEVPEDEKPTPLMGTMEYFDEIRLHYALNYVAYRYHEDLMIWAAKALKPGGILSIVSPDIDWVLTRWLAEAIHVNIQDYIVNNEQKESKIKAVTALIKRMLKGADIPETQFEPVDRKIIVKEVPDIVLEDIESDWDFDLWLMQQIYSSGAGEPQDCFKALFGKRYLSTLLRRALFVVTMLQNNPNNPKQMEATAYKHPSRLLNIK